MARHYVLLAAVMWSVFCSFGAAVQAHDPGLSAAILRLMDNQVTAHLTFARREIDTLVPLDANRDGTVTAEELATARAHLAALGPDLLTLSSAGLERTAQLTTVALDQSDALHVWLQFPPLTDERLRVTAPILARLARGHRQYLSVRDAQERPLLARILDAEQASVELHHTPVVASSAPSFRQFVRLGVEHIVTGYDHVLFLFSLLIVGGSVRSTARIITSFTVAHSLTLALATCDVVHLPATLVEPLIAASIIYVGLENLWRRDLHSAGVSRSVLA